jgi:hypothetical protein
MASRIPIITTAGQEDLSNIAILKSKRGFLRTDFIVDTGSSKTVIPYEQAIRLQLPLTKKTYDFRFVGQMYDGFQCSEIVFVFMSEDGEKIEENFPVIVLKPKSVKKHAL